MVLEIVGVHDGLRVNSDAELVRQPLKPGLASSGIAAGVEIETEGSPPS